MFPLRRILAILINIINRLLNFNNGHPIAENGSNYHLFWNALNLNQAHIFSYIIIENFHYHHFKVNKPVYPEINPFFGITSLPEEKIIESKLNLNFFTKSISIFVENCIFYALNNIVSKKLI